VPGFEIERSDETDWPICAVPKTTSVVESTMLLLVELTCNPPHPNRSRHPVTRTGAMRRLHCLSVDIVEEKREYEIRECIMGPTRAATPYLLGI